MGLAVGAEGVDAYGEWNKKNDCADYGRVDVDGNIPASGRGDGGPECYDGADEATENLQTGDDTSDDRLRQDCDDERGEGLE